MGVGNQRQSPNVRHLRLFSGYSGGTGPDILYRQEQQIVQS